jgi:hypothetical protein
VGQELVELLPCDPFRRQGAERITVEPRHTLAPLTEDLHERAFAGAVVAFAKFLAVGIDRHFG